jgi:aminoglycoside 3-N-acetyltransferase
MFFWLPKEVKHLIKGWLKRLHLGYVRKKYAFTPHDLLVLLRKLGVQQGDVLLVHSSFDRFGGFTGKATDVIHILQEAVGFNGTILVPTMPFNGSAVEYVSQGKVFDPLRTPSCMGLITELFRRSAGVMRSIHPTHAVAAWGAKAQEMIADHYLAGTPCGRQTPYGRLIDYNGKILFLGKDIGVMTFYHTIEEELESQMPSSPFTHETFSLHSRGPDTNILVTHTRLFDPSHSRRRNLDKLVPILRERGYWKEGYVGRLGVILLDAKSVLEASQLLAEKGVYCYEQ